MPERRLRVVIADDRPELLQSLQDFVSRLGHEVVATASTGRELLERCCATRPDLIITDVRMPEMDGLGAAEAFDQDVPTPAILLSEDYDDETLRRAAGDHVMACLVKPVTIDDLRAAIAIAAGRFAAFQEARREARELRQALEDRKLLEQAKGIVTRRLRLDEPEAYRRLRKLSSDQNWKLLDIARQIVEADEIFAAIEKAGP